MTRNSNWGHLYPWLSCEQLWWMFSLVEIEGVVAWKNLWNQSNVNYSQELLKNSLCLPLEDLAAKVPSTKTYIFADFYLLQALWSNNQNMPNVNDSLPVNSRYRVAYNICLNKLPTKTGAKGIGNIIIIKELGYLSWWKWFNKTTASSYHVLNMTVNLFIPFKKYRT